MAKKKGGKSKGQVSAGIHSNVSSTLRRAMRKDYLASGDRIINQLAAFRKGKNVMVTIENPNKNETNKRFIRVPGSQVWKS
jgi:ribosomal protein L21E